MREPPREFEIVWLTEAERRISEGLPLESREMMVELRDRLPRGFKPSNINSLFLSSRGPSVLGLQAIGDSTGLLPDIERTIRHIRDRLIAQPLLERVSAAEIAEVLQAPVKRAERVLALVSSLGQFSSGGSGTANGYSEIHLGREEVVAEYLAFDVLDGLLANRAETRPSAIPVFGPYDFPPEVREQGRDSAFILMNMDPRDDTLADIYNAMKSVCAAFNIEAIRIDDVEHQERITDRILEMIESTDLIIADLTGERPNVYYEVGYAHAIGKRPILYRKKDTRLHFDLSVHNVPEYKNVTELKTLLHKRLEAILGRAARTQSAG